MNPSEGTAGGAAENRIRTVIFDMDGTLADTERLKAMAYSDVLAELLNLEEPDPRVLPLYAEFVGDTDRALCEVMVERFGIAELLDSHVRRLGVGEAWEALHLLRLDHYRRTQGRPEVIAENAIQHNVALLRAQHAAGRTVAVATSSMTDEASRVLEAIGLIDLLGSLVGRDQVIHAKPDPEIYLKTAALLGTRPAECLVIEDSPLGAKSALAAEMACVVVANQFTARPLRSQSLIEQKWIAYAPSEVPATVDARIAAAERGYGSS